jgi:hypothetical protein
MASELLGWITSDGANERMVFTHVPAWDAHLVTPSLLRPVVGSSNSFETQGEWGPDNVSDVTNGLGQAHE